LVAERKLGGGSGPVGGHTSNGGGFNPMRSGGGGPSWRLGPGRGGRRRHNGIELETGERETLTCGPGHCAGFKPTQLEFK
jgi:hypothetical protein